MPLSPLHKSVYRYGNYLFVLQSSLLYFISLFRLSFCVRPGLYLRCVINVHILAGLSQSDPHVCISYDHMFEGEKREREREREEIGLKLVWYSVCPIYLTTPNSAPVTNTFIPVSKVTLVMEERERGEVVREGVCEEVEEVRGCLARGTLLWYTAKDDVIMMS